MTELHDLIWSECYRPQTLDDLIFDKKDVINNYFKNPKLIPSFIFESKSPGCQPKGQKVLMFDGSWKDVKNIIEGDLVLSPQKDDSWRASKVLSTKKYISNIYTVKLRTRNRTSNNSVNKRSYRVAEEHLIVGKCKYCNETPVFTPLQIRKSELRKVYGILSPAVQYINKQKHFKIPPYHMGIILGDGGISGTGEIKRLGLLGKKSGDKFIPQEYLRGTVGQRLELLAGLIDTDGYKRKRKDSSGFSYGTKSKQLAKDIHYLCQSLGFGSNIYEVTKKWRYKGIKKRGTYYSIYISPQDLIIPTKIPRKKHILRNKDWKNIRLKSMEIIPENKKEMVYGFTLDSKSGWYITNDWIVTHNTGKSSLAKIIVNTLGCDYKKINASDDRGIDTIREQVILFAQALSTNGLKRCIILEESDSMCLHKDTDVYVVENNKLITKKIETLVDKNINVLSYSNQKGKLEVDNATGLYNEFAEMYEVVLENGSSVICSDSHPFFITQNKEMIIKKRLYDLKEGDSIVTFENEVFHL